MNVELARYTLTRRPKTDEQQLRATVQSIKHAQRETVSSYRYDDAVRLRGVLQETEQSAVDRAYREEESRQEVERQRLDEGLDLMYQEVKAEWDAKAEKERAACEYKRTAMQQKHQRERTVLELELKKLANPPTKYTRELLDLIRYHDILCSAQKFEEAQRFGAQIQTRKVEEEAKFRESIAKSLEIKRTQLRARQDGEMLMLEQALKDRMLHFERERDNAFKQFEATRRNHHRDMAHAHRLEFALRKGTHNSCQVDLPTLKHRSSFATHASTFRGTLLREKVVAVQRARRASSRASAK